MNRAIDTGVTLIDTENGSASGASETLFGGFLRERHDEFSLATKVGSPTGDPWSRLAPRTIRQELTGSLQRLRTNDLNPCYLHRPDRDVPLAETHGTLAELQAGDFHRARGCSYVPLFELARMRCIAAANEWKPILISQPLYDVLSRRIEDAYIEATTALKISNNVFKSLAGGGCFLQAATDKVGSRMRISALSMHNFVSSVRAATSAILSGLPLMTFGGSQAKPTYRGDSSVFDSFAVSPTWRQFSWAHPAPVSSTRTVSTLSGARHHRTSVTPAMRFAF